MRKMLVVWFVVTFCGYMHAMTTPVVAPAPAVAAAPAAPTPAKAGVGDYLWDVAKKKVIPAMILATIPLLIHPVVREWMGSFKRGNEAILRIEDRIGDLRQYQNQIFKAGLYGGAGWWFYRYGHQHLTAVGMNKVLARIVQCAGLCGCAWYFVKSPLDFTRKVALQGRVPRWRCEQHADDEPRVELPSALMSVCERFHTRAGDAEFLDCRGAVLLKGSAGVAAKQQFVRSMAYVIGTDLIYDVSYDDVRAALADKSAAEVIGGLMEWASKRAAYYNRPLALWYIRDFDRWLDDVENDSVAADALRVLLDRIEKQGSQFSGRLAEAGQFLDQMHKAERGDAPKQATPTFDVPVDDALNRAFGSAFVDEEHQFNDLFLRARVLVIGLTSGFENNALMRHLEHAPSFKKFAIDLSAQGTVALDSLPNPFVGKSRVFALSKVPRETLQDLAGQYPWQLDLLLDICRHPERYPQHNIPPSLLLYGGPGTGKTTLARALAGSLGEQLIEVDVAQLITSKHFAGDINDIFNAAHFLAATNHSRHAIVFLDEIGSAARPREEGSPKDAAIVEALLKKMEGFDGADGQIIVLATGNARPERLDEAFVRPMRFLDLVDVKANDGAAGALVRHFMHAGARQAGAGAASASEIPGAFRDQPIEQPSEQELAMAAQGLTPAEIKAAVLRAQNIAIWLDHECVNSDIMRELQSMRELRERRVQARQQAHGGPAAGRA